MKARWLVAVVLAACASEPPAARERLPLQPSAKTSPLAAEGQPSAEPARGATGERRFGASLSLPGPPLDVAQVLAEPGPHLGKVIQCAGTIARVCEQAGCWLELRPDAGEGGLRVPMAGHAFFIPTDAAGHRAVVEGELSARELSPGQRAHLESEGLKAIGPLALSATAVVVR